MNSLLILITAIIFFFIGRLSSTPNKEIKEEVKRKFRELKAKGIPTVITYPTREEQDYEESDQAKIDKQIEDNLKEKGL